MMDHIIKAPSLTIEIVSAYQDRPLPHIVKSHVARMEVDFSTLIPQLTSLGLVDLFNSALHIVRIEYLVHFLLCDSYQSFVARLEIQTLASGQFL